MSLERMSFGQRMVQLFQREGVEAIFSQGDLTMRDIQKHAELQGLKIVGPRHEAAGVFMADAYYRMSGVPQVAIGAMGPGQANLLPAVICAAQEHIPVIVLGSRRQSTVDSGIRRSRFLHAPIFDCFASVCKSAARITHPGELDEIIQDAFRQALTGTPGPVYVEYDFVMHEAEWEYPATVQAPETYRVCRLPASEELIGEAVKLLEEANCPLLLGGTGILTSGTSDLFERLARRLGCPVFTTIGGSGALPETDGQWISYYSEAGQAVLNACDLVVALGTSMPETLNYGRQRRFASGNQARKWIQVDQDAAAIGVNRPIDLPIVGRLQDVLPQLCDAVDTSNASRSTPELAAWRQQYVNDRAEAVRALQGAETINPSLLMAEAREGVPDEAIIVIDSGLTLMHQIAFFEKRSRHFLWTSKYGHLGSGMPYAIGAMLQTAGETPVCLISGDGGLGFHFMEFETAVRHNLPIVIVVNDDQALGAEMQAHQDHIGHTIQVSFSPVRLDQMAEAMGGHGEFVDQAEGIQPAVRRAFAARKPAIVQVKTDPESAVKYPVPLIEDLMSWLMEDASATASRSMSIWN